MIVYELCFPASSAVATDSLVAVVPGIFGALNSETEAVLGYLDLPRPSDGLDLLKTADEICLVDTHHRKQLPPELPFDKVVEVVDHHPSGDAPPLAAYIKNEPVGAAATLLAERLLGAAAPLSRTVCLLLLAAISSNTLEFSAPSTSVRDHEAFDRLEGLFRFPDGLLSELRQGRRLLLAGSTLEVLERDVKVFSASNGQVVVMSQVEAPNAAALGRRDDLSDALEALRVNASADSVLVNLVDLSLSRSLLVCPSKALQTQLRDLHLSFDSSGQAWAEVLMLRKTHLVPLVVGE